MALARDPNPSVTRLLGEARFVFTGTAEWNGASSLSFIPAGGETAVVRVDRIHLATPVLQNQVGQHVTVVFAAGAPPEIEGRPRVFFTNPFLYGETIAVREVGHIEAPEDINALHEQVAHMTEEFQDERLREHLGSAEAVVLGRVIGLKSAGHVSAAEVSEHDPDWWIATVQVVRSFKGDLKGEIAFRYPNSRDVAWYRVPKPREGEEAIFILHRDDRHAGRTHLAILHPEDVQHAGDAGIRRIAGLTQTHARGSKRSAEDK